MRKYKASEIVDRALHLADLTNTDFLTHKEHIEYINDAWKNVYQFLINKGDKRFVQEVMLSGANGMTEFDLPEDLYQIQSLKEYNTNRLIRRKADSESDNSGTYEVFNNKLRVYGLSTGHLVLTYYVNPIYITFPDKTIKLDNLIREIYNTYKNTAVLKQFNSDVFRVENLIEGNTIYSDTSKPDQISDYGYVYGDEIFDWGNNSLGQLSAEVSDNVYTNVPNVILNGAKVEDLNGNVIINSGANILAYFKGKNNKHYYIANNSLIDGDDTTGNVTPLKTFNGITVLGITSNGLVYKENTIDTRAKVLTITEEGNIIVHYCPHQYFLGVIDYGYVYNDRVESCWDDTLFDFPNDIYIALLSYELAIRYALKQNASVEHLQVQLQQAQAQFASSLNSDGAFKRISKVY